MHELAQHKQVVMAQMNNVISKKQSDGYSIMTCKPGVKHRQESDGSTQHNLYYHILLKKVLPQPPPPPESS